MHDAETQEQRMAMGTMFFERPVVATAAMSTASEVCVHAYSIGKGV